ncbi:hypothetical protein Zm00014a_031131 [Zea mays]|uniref:Uncharacterized protein n=1 Tax=Zea mays TaxID=4577 RepID=A0A3L6DMU8_MAIZE|nr:hypothetical protein Zm00014a_031131 [Zea mays]
MGCPTVAPLRRPCARCGLVVERKKRARLLLDPI